MEGALSVTSSGDANRSRKRMKEEIETLRTVVAELESNLASLRAPANAPSVERQVVEAAWADIAARQRTLRYSAEVENAKLRTLVEDQLRLCKQLERVVHKRQHMNADWALARRARLHGIVSETSSLDDVRILKLMKASMPRLLEQTEQMFARVESSSSDSGPFRSIDLRSSDKDGICVEALHRRVMPFDTNALSDAMIEQFQHNARQKTQSVDEDGFATYDSSSLINTERYQGSIHSKVVLRRVDHPNQTVIVFTALTDTSSIANASTDGLYVRHDGWCRIRERAADTSVHGASMGEVLVAVVGYPETYNPSPDHSRKIATTLNFILATITFQMDAGNEIMDNYLLDRARSAV